MSCSNTSTATQWEDEYDEDDKCDGKDGEDVDRLQQGWQEVLRPFVPEPLLLKATMLFPSIEHGDFRMYSS